MTGLNTGFSRCKSFFQPLTIIQDGPKISASTTYNILDRTSRRIGRFDFCDNGYVCGLELNPEIRRKKTAADAILSVKDFVIKKAKEMGIDFIHFVSAYNNKHNVKRLYEKLGADVISKDSVGFVYATMVPLEDSQLAQIIPKAVADAKEIINKCPQLS